MTSMTLFTCKYVSCEYELTIFVFFLFIGVCLLFRYPIAVEPIHASNYRTGAKRSAQNYDDVNQTGLQFKRVQPPNDKYDTEVRNICFLALMRII